MASPLTWRRALVACVVLQSPRLLFAQPAAQPAAPVAAPAVCDAKLLRAATQGTTAYRVRGRGTTWCEGTYAEEVGGVEMTLEGFGRPLLVDSTRARRIDTLWVEWQAPPGSDVRLIGRSRARGFYQLDAQLRTDSTGRGRWPWPTDVLRQQAVFPFGIPIVRPAPEVWVQAIAAVRAGSGTVDSVHVPVRLTYAGDTTPPSANFELRLLVNTRIERARATVQRRGEDGALVAVAMRDGCRAPYGGLGRGSPLVVPVCLASDAPGGVYTLTVGGDASGAMARPAVMRFWIRGVAR
ncbi:MAG: hypothetical protein LCH84_02340 [Gemmatimonadetes bacterium]|nr:hypothetical protein [Gemmatimonadota bacterium]